MGILKSIDGGKTWAPVNNGLDDLYVGCLRMHPTNPQILFAATGNNACSGLYNNNIISGLFKTINGGASWIKVISNDLMATVNFSPSNPDTIYAGSLFAFYRSENGGATWSRFSQPSSLGYGPPGVVAGFPIDVTADPDNPFVVYANNYGGGVFRSLDGAETWEVWSKGYSGADIHIVHIPADTPSSVYAIGRSGPFASLNYGKDWVGIANGDASFTTWDAIVTKPTSSNVMIISDEHQGSILISSDRGKDFSEVFRQPDAYASDPNKRQGFRGLTFAPSSPNVVYAGLSKDRLTFLSSSPLGTVIYKSQDGGMTFSPMPSALDGINVRRLVVDPANADIVYAATTNGVYKSSNGAASWTRIGSLGGNNIEALAIDPLQPGYIIAGEIFGGIWMSTNGGANWTGPLNTGFNSPNPYISSLVVDPVNPNTVFAGDLYSGVYRSLDKGVTWAAFPDWKMSGLAVRAVKDIAISANVMYAATQGGGVFRFDRVPIPTSTPCTTLLWAETTGRASIRTLDVYGHNTSTLYYGPYAGWAPRSYHRNSNGTANMLWGRVDGYVSLWAAIDASGNPTSKLYYGPYVDWTAKCYNKNSYGTANMLWGRTDGLTALWMMDASNNQTDILYYGPYPGWTAKSYHGNSDGTANMLWGRTDGYVSLWTMDASGNPTSMSYYGPYEGWTAKSYYRNSDGTANMLWAENTGRASIWMMDTSGNRTSEMLYGPYEGWTAQDYD